ncbi:hypothetical protein STENM223S_05632 [Streptomyces tendae]
MVAESRGDDLEVGGRAGHGPLVEQFAHTGQEGHPGEFPGEHEHSGVEQGDDGDEDLAHPAPRLAGEPDRVGVALGRSRLTSGPDAVSDRGRPAPWRGPARWRRPRGSRGSRTCTARRPGRAGGCARCRRRRRRCRGRVVVDDDAGADAGGDLQQYEGGAVAVVGLMLGQRHQVGVVVHEDRHGPAASGLVPTGRVRLVEALADAGPAVQDGATGEVAAEHSTDRCRSAAPAGRRSASPAGRRRTPGSTGRRSGRPSRTAAGPSR